MSDTQYEELLHRVYERLLATSSTTDHLMLTRWRVLSASEYLLGGSDAAIENASIAALDVFASVGAGARTDKALHALAMLIRNKGTSSQTVLPRLGHTKRQAVSQRLREFARDGDAAIDRAIGVLPRTQMRVQATARALCMPGIRYRLALIEEVLQDHGRSASQRLSAASAVLYVDDVNDTIPDTLSAVGMLDDDYALRLSLSDIDGGTRESHLHWSERIASLWDDLPFLQGVDLRRGPIPIAVTWLDRVNSYVSYTHVLEDKKAPLVLLQPSIACSPLHAIVSLIGLLVLDALTSARDKARVLRPGGTYELDDCTVVFEEVDTVRRPNWLRLRLRNNCFAYARPDAVDRLIPVERTRLSSERAFLARQQDVSSPLQRFFNWDSGISQSSISTRIVLVTSRHDALKLLENVESNRVRLLEHGLARFISSVREPADTRGAVLLIVPSLVEARQLLDGDSRIQAVVVDGYARLYRGRHELPFLMNREDGPSIIIWSPTGYYPDDPPAWLPEHTKLEVSSEDLASILELDTMSSDLNTSSLWEAATGLKPSPFDVPVPPHEQHLLDAIDSYLRRVRSAAALPDYWKYHLAAQARGLRGLIGATPAEWRDIKLFAESCSASIDAKWSLLRPSALERLSELRAVEAEIHLLIDAAANELNSRASGLKAFLASSELRPNPSCWSFVCDRQEQIIAVRSLVRRPEFKCVSPVLLRDLEVCSPCVVAGWGGGSFARRLWAHTPSLLVTITDVADQQRWARSAERRDHHSGSQSLLETLGKPAARRDSVPTLTPWVSAVESSEDDAAAPDDAQPEELVSCAFLELAGEPEVKVLARESRVIVEESTHIRERHAAALRPSDRILLDRGMGRWSPAEEFTENVVAAVRASQPELAEMAGEWRRALRAFRDEDHLSMLRLRGLLGAVGIVREEQTIDGWLDLSRASPIAPRALQSELAALWPLVQAHARFPLASVVTACNRLRSLRTAASKALLQAWKGQRVSLAVDQSWLAELVEELRQTTHSYEVTSVSLGMAPRAVIGWWIDASISARFETAGSNDWADYSDGEDAESE